MGYDISGKVSILGKVETYGANGGQKRILVLTTEEGTWKQDVCIEFDKEKVELLNNIEVGQDVNISFNISSREWNGKYFTNLRGWRIGQDTSKAATPTPVVPVSPSIDDYAEYDDDIPF